MPQEEVTTEVTTPPTFASAREAAEVVRAGLGFLAAADATQLTAETQAECLQMLEQVTAMGTAARTSILAAFTSAQGYCADADYSPRAWLINKTRITKGAAVSYTAWVRRAAAHPLVADTLAAGELSESYARTICTWTDKLPEDCRPDADAILLAAAGAGMDLPDLAALAAEIYARSRPGTTDEDKDEAFEDRSLSTVTTLDCRVFAGHVVVAIDATSYGCGLPGPAEAGELAPELQVLAVGLLECCTQGLGFVAVLFLELGDLAGQGLDDRVVAVCRCRWRGAGCGRAWARRCSIRARRSGFP